MPDAVMIVNTGLALVTNRLRSLGNEPKHIHWGTGSVAPAAANTTLGTARSEARTDGTSTQQTTTTANDTYRVVGTLTCASTSAAITEAGLFDAATSGILFLRGTFDPINLNVDDSIEFTINTVFARA